MNILIIGCGSIGQRHARNAKEIANISLCDNDASKVTALAEEFGCAYFTDMGEALGTKPDGVIIALPNKYHYEAAKAALENGSHVLVEKPICNLIEEAKDLAEIGGDRLHVVSNMRFHQAIEALKDGMTHIGKPLFARAQFGNYLPNMRPGVDYRDLYVAKRSEGGGVVMDCIHEIDYLSYLLGQPTAVTATLDKISDLELDSEDYAHLCVTHQNSIRSEIHLDYLQKIKQRGCEIIGSEGTVIWRSTGKNPEHCVVEYTKADDIEWTRLLDTKNLDHNACYVALLQSFCAAINGKQDPRCSSADEALKALACVHSAYKSSEEKRMIEISEILGPETCHIQKAKKRSNAH